MRVNKLHTPVGLRDILSEEYDKRQVLLRRMEDIFYRSGYRGIETPMLEYLDVFSAEALGGLDPKEMYKLFDRDGAALALRADMTPPIARVAATAYANEAIPLRFCYFGNAFRENASYQGKAHEFSQAGVELLGVNSPAADGEVLSLAIHSLLACGLKEMRIHVGQVEFFNGILEEAGLSPEDSAALQDCIARRDYVASEAMLSTLELSQESKELFYNLPKLVGKAQVLTLAGTMTKNPRALQALESLSQLYHILCAYGVADYVNFDLGMVHKLGYYTGIIFRGYTYGSGYSLVDGGRYDHLAEQFGKARPAVGFAIRMGGLMEALEHQKIEIPIEKTQTLVAYAPKAEKAALAAATLFRSMELGVEVSLIGNDLEENYVYAKKRGMQRLLYFLDDVRMKVTLFTDEGDFDLDTTLPQLMHNLGGGGQ